MSKIEKLFKEYIKQIKKDYPQEIIDISASKADFTAGYQLCEKEYEEKLRWIPISEKMPDVDSIIECKYKDKVFFSGKVVIKKVEHIDRYYLDGMFHGTGNIDLLYNFTEWRSFL